MDLETDIDSMRSPLVRLLALACLVAPGCAPSPDPIDSPGEQASLPFAWPPVLGQQYPDLQLQDAEGEPFELSSLRGRVLLIEPVGMT